MRVVRQLDASLWSQFVERSARGNIFHTPEMFEVFAGARGHHPRVWTVIDDRGHVMALFPTVDVTVVDGLLSHFTTRTVAYGSVLSDPGGGAQEALDLLFGTYRRETNGRILFTELRNLADLRDLQPVLSNRGFSYEPHLNYLIDLTRPPSEIWNGLRSNARGHISKARKSGVVIEEVSDPNGIPAVYALLREVYKRFRVPLPHQSLFESAFRVLYPRGMLRILLARLPEGNIGVRILLIYKSVVYDWYAGTLRRYSTCGVADLLVWHALLLGQQTACGTFDFGGAGRPDEDYGVRDFKAKFGGCLVNFGRNICIHSPLRLRVSRAGYQLVKRFL